MLNVRWMYTQWQNCQYMMPWDENALRKQSCNL